jgi:hypothetical protein
LRASRLRNHSVEVARSLPAWLPNRNAADW